jgi:glycosyltransferase involved in cell wall biosynthesis
VAYLGHWLYHCRDSDVQVQISYRQLVTVKMNHLQSEVQLAVVLMVKNEEKRIETTLNSVKDVVDGIILFDTGSEDKTVEIVKQFAEKHNIHFHLLQGQFEDFATSRNMLLDFADKLLYDYLLLLDSNDEYRCDKNLKQLINGASEEGFLLHQRWYVGPYEELDYYNIRLIKSNTGFRYKGSVHEYIDVPPGAKIGKMGDIILYQDRVKDNDGKSQTRWKKDLTLLKRNIAMNPNNGRSQYYLAQTYDCLNMKADAMFFYKQRANNEDGFFEERFNSMMKCGQLERDEDDSVKWYLKAYQLIERAEPLIGIVRIYRKRGKFKLAFLFAKLACELPYPSNCILWVNQRCYNHDRWQELGIVAYYVKEHELGQKACEKAVESGYDVDLNKKNLIFYEKCGLRKQS